LILRSKESVIVVKLGGEVVDSPILFELARDLQKLVASGRKVVVSHGGGPQATRLSKRLGLEPKIVGGRRVTDEATLDVMKMTVAGQVSVDLCARLRSAGLRPVGLHGLVRAHRRPPTIVSGGGPEPVDFGHVGDVDGFDLQQLELLLSAGYLPVVACLGHDATGALYNINADLVANQLAGTLHADALLLVTSTPGVLRQVDDRQSRIPTLTVREGRQLIEEGLVSGGMIPKLEDSFAALSLGVRAIYILDGQIEEALRTPGSVGTILLP
jgi:acetylglutamate kinase